jgi:hypothetical protein
MTDHSTTKRRHNPLTHLFVACCTAFVLTVFLMVAAAFNPRGAALNGFFDRHGLMLLGVEVGVILGLAVVVMAVERRETRRQIEERERALLLEGSDAARSREAESVSPPTREATP